MRSMPIPAWLRPAPDSEVASAIAQGKSPWIDAVHLAWSVWVFLTPLFQPDGYDLRWVLLTLVSYPLFLLLYALCLLGPRPATWRPALAMVAMGIVLLPVYPACMSYFIFGCVMLAYHDSRLVGGYFLQWLVLNTGFLALAWWVGYPWQFLLWLPVVTLVVGFVVRVERISQARNIELKLSHDEVRRLAAIAERERIGRDLHDLLGHTLSLITLKLELARKLFDADPATARRELAETEGIARDALAEVRSAVTGIRAADLAAELASAHLLLESSGVRLDCDPPPALPPELERALALVLREAVTNISRHARATSARIGFTRADGTLTVLIADDGRGGISREGNGLSGMRERVARLGGTLQVESPRGAGTRLALTLPLPAAAGAVNADMAAAARPTTAPAAVSLRGPDALPGPCT